MALVRTILAGLIAFSLALLPAAVAPVAAAEGTAMAMAADMSADMSPGMDDCCPNHAKPCDSTRDQCRLMAACACQFLTLSSIAFSRLEYLQVPGRTIAVLGDSAPSPHLGSPPFRPPRT
jgi:hypothetical protein